MRASVSFSEVIASQILHFPDTLPNRSNVSESNALLSNNEESCALINNDITV